MDHSHYQVKIECADALKKLGSSSMDPAKLQVLYEKGINQSFLHGFFNMTGKEHAVQ